MSHPVKRPLRIAASLLLAVSTLAGCVHDHRQPSAAVLYQTSTIQALLEGVYDSDITVADVLEHGDFGLGTFDQLDGEMIVLDGQVFQVPVAGRARRVDGRALTPFAAVVRFTAAERWAVSEPASFDQLQANLDKMRTTSNAPYAFRIDGSFSSMRTRSVPLQTKPYKRLADAVREQVVFDLKSVEGTLVGFWFPQSMSNLNVAGYHFHFISRDRTVGGHVLSCQLTSGQIESMEATAIHIRMPMTSAFRNKRFETTTQPAELQGIER